MVCILSTLLFSVLGILTVHAETEVIDIVKLKNGSIIKGKILEIRPQKHVKIELRDGSIFVFKM